MRRSTLVRLLMAAAGVAAILAAGVWSSRRVNASRGMAITSRAGAALSMQRLREEPSTEPAEVAGDASGPDALPVIAPKLVRTASLSLEIPRYAQAARTAAGIAARHGGYLAGEHLASESGERPRGTLTLRVPAGRFDEAIEALKALGRVESLDLSTQDISREYADLQTRLAAKRAAELRMRDLLRTPSARLQDLVQAEREDARLIEEIDRLEGERRFDDAVLALSVVTLELHEPAAFVRDNALTPLSRAVRQALPLLAASVAGMVYAIAAGAPWALLAWLLWKRHRRAVPTRPIGLRAEG